jgi:cold shock protein
MTTHAAINIPRHDMPRPRIMETVASPNESEPALAIRRPELRGTSVRRLGTVRWWKNDKGYGRITADDGEILWASFIGIEGDGWRCLEAGQRVSFMTDDRVADHNRSVDPAAAAHGA